MNKNAQALGRMAKGKPKNYSKAERKRRAERLAVARSKRWRAKSNKAITVSGYPAVTVDNHTAKVEGGGTA